MAGSSLFPSVAEELPTTPLSYFFGYFLVFILDACVSVHILDVGIPLTHLPCLSQGQCEETQCGTPPTVFPHSLNTQSFSESF